MENEKIVEAVSDKMDGAVAEIASALKQAVSEYGPDAVDLALVAFRVEAASHLLGGLIAAVVAVVIWKVMVKVWAMTQKGWDEGLEGPAMIRCFGTGLGSVVLVFSVIAAVARLSSISAWIAVFGYPELRIAIKALEAAGLM
jgi:hypothetical protein